MTKHLIISILIVSCTAFSALQLDLLSIEAGFEPGIQTYIISKTDHGNFDSRDDSSYEMLNRLNYFCGLKMSVHNGLGFGISFKVIDGKYSHRNTIQDYRMGALSIGGNLVIPINGDLSVFTAFYVGMWDYLMDDDIWVDIRSNIFTDIKIGADYRFLDELSFRLYLNRDFLYYEWVDNDFSTCWHEWNIGISADYYPYKK